MLVLTRKAGQRIVIGQNIVITVVSQQGDRVKLGFEAPADVSIHRQEVAARIDQEQQAERDRWSGAPADASAEETCCWSGCAGGI